jgi:putative drug exporter of the RND superfamily
MLARLASYSFRRRWTVIVCWLLALVGITAANGAFGGDFGFAGRLDGTDSQRAYDLLDERFPTKSGASAVVVFADAEGIASFEQDIDAYLDELRAVDGIADVTSPFVVDGQIAADGTVAFAGIDVDPDLDTFDAVTEEVRDRAGPLQDRGLQVEFAGDAFVEGELPASEALGLLAAVVILLIAFGSVLAAGLPLVTAVTTPDFTVQVASMIGIGVGIDYALFIVTRFREAKARGLDAHSATVEAASTAGRAVVFAGLTVMVSLLGMILMRLGFVNGLALGSSTAVLVAVLAAITLLPAMLGLFGRQIPAMRTSKRQDGGVWVRWSRVLQRNPLTAALAGFAVLAALAAPTLALRLGDADAGSRTEDQTVRRAYDLLADGFSPGFNGPFLLAADLADRDVAELDPVLDAVRGADGVAYVSEPQPSPAGDAAVVTVIPETSPQDERTNALLHRLRDDVIPSATSAGGIDVFVGGVTASNVDFAEVIAQRLPWFIGAVLVCSFLLLLVTFRSVLVPLKAVVMNLLSIGAAYGVMVMVFQWGWFGSLFGVGEGAPIAPWAPMMLFAIVFGLSMDYEVFLLSKIRERYDATGDNATAVAEGVASTARVITAAAAIMVCVFGFFVFGDLREIKLIGLGLATAVFIDATIVRLVLVPATMELLGDRNWWLPRWLDRILPNVSIDSDHRTQSAPTRDDLVSVGRP